MPKSASKKQIKIIFDYIHDLLPDLEMFINEIIINKKTRTGIYIQSNLDKETNQILIGLIFNKAAELKIVNKDGSMNIDTVAVSINKKKYLVLYFT